MRQRSLRRRRDNLGTPIKDDGQQTRIVGGINRIAVQRGEQRVLEPFAQAGIVQ